jgi:hypothetical protein
MSTEPRGRDLFIVDNSVSGWTGLRYLEEWCGIAKARAKALTKAQRVAIARKAAKTRWGR